MVVIDGDHIMVNTHLKSYRLAIAEVKRVVRRSRDYVYFEKLDGEKVELDISDLNEQELGRFKHGFGVVPEDQIAE